MKSVGHNNVAAVQQAVEAKWLLRFQTSPLRKLRPSWERVYSARPRICTCCCMDQHPGEVANRGFVMQAAVCCQEHRRDRGRRGKRQIRRQWHHAVRVAQHGRAQAAGRLPEDLITHPESSKGYYYSSHYLRPNLKVQHICTRRCQGI